MVDRNESGHHTMTDIVERLRTLYGTQPIVMEAAAEIEQLRAENARLREALRPFALSADDADKDDAKHGESWMVLAGWLRNARAALQEKTDEG